MRKLNDMFHIDGEQLIKTSNNQPVPADEPLFILRGRDNLSVYTLAAYIYACGVACIPADRIEQLEKVYMKFVEYQRKHPTKVPGSTHGR